MDSPAPRGTVAARSHLHIAICALLAGTVFAVVSPRAAVAAESAVQTDVRTYDIAPGPLAERLAEFAAAAGVQILFDANTLRGLRSDTLHGIYSVANGFEQLLEGSGYEAVASGHGEYTLQKVVNATVLKPVNVRAQALEATTEGSRTYTATGPTTTATGLAMTTRQTPQSISVVTTQQVLDRNDHSLDQALRYAPGINISQVGDARWAFTSRGFAIGDIQYDGASTFNTSNATGDSYPQPDMAIFDRVEIVRGATGLMTGTGDPSGSINLVRKRAQSEHSNDLEIGAGSIGKGSLMFDASRALNDTGSVRGRVVARGEAGAASQRDDHEREYGLLYATLDVDLSANTQISVAASYGEENIDGAAWGGWPTQEDGTFFLNYDAKTSPTLPWEYHDLKQTTIYFDLKHRFNSDWELKVTARDAHGEGDKLASAFYWGGGELNRYGWLDWREIHSYSGSLSIAGPITLFGRKHELTFGASGNTETVSSDLTGSYGWVVPDPLHLDQPDAKNILTLSPVDSGKERTKQKGIYAAGRFELADPLHLIVGSRLSWYDYEFDYIDAAYDADAEPIPYVGIVYDASEALTLYSSYTNIFKPQSQVNTMGAQLDPAEGKNIEIGVKAALLDKGQLIANFAIYQSEQTGLPERVAGPCSRPDVPSCYRSAEEVRTRGVDIELVGMINERWQVSASYTYANSEYVAGPSSGERFNAWSMPRNMVKLYSTYDFAGDWQSLTIGGGVRVQSELIEEAEGFYRVRQSGYAVVDVLARYELTTSTHIQLNVDNLFDRTYYNSVGYYSSAISPGRTASLTLRTSF